MKTIDKVQKTVLKSLVLITGFVLISVTVIAQDFRSSFTQNKASNELALATADRRIELQPESTTLTASKGTSTVTNQLLTEYENTMELEAWMTDADLFCIEQIPSKKTMISTANFVYRELEEPGLVMANWMFNLKYWGVKTINTK